MKPSPLAPQHATLLGNGVVVDVISKDEVIMLEWSGPFTQYDWCLYKRGKFELRLTHR